MKKVCIVLSLIILIMTTSLAGCTSEPVQTDNSASVSESMSSDATTSAVTETPAFEEDPVLTLYTPESEGLINAIVPGFEKETGIKVEVITAGTGELLTRIEAEKDNPIADVLMGSSPTVLNTMKEYFMPYVSPNDQYLREGHHNENGYFTSFKSDGSVILVNTNLIGDITVEGYADLLNPALKGKIAHADSASSSSAFEQLVNMLNAMGKDNAPDSQEAWDYVNNLLINLEGKIASGSSAVHKGVADGEYTVGLTWEDPACTYVKDGAPVKVVYAKEGVIYNDATIQIINGAKHPENAKKFIDYVISAEVQDLMGTELCNRAVREGAKVGAHMVPIDDIKVINNDKEWTVENKQYLVEKFTELVADVQ